MNRLYRSTQTEAFARGEEFGRAHGARIAAVIEGYRTMWRGHAPGHDAMADGERSLAATQGFAPHLAAEMHGMAKGAGLDPRLIGAINARTEILGALRAPTRGECSAVIALGEGGNMPPVAVQTWDWYHRFRDTWMVWEIPLEDGTTTRTMTECGIVGKAGMNTRGLGLLFTILHHSADGQGIGVPVHVVARATLDLGANIAHAAQIAASAGVSASTSLNLSAWDGKRAAAITVEVYPGGPGFVLPDAAGLLVHTNHFLDPRPAACDTEPKANPDTLLRRDMLMRQLSGGVRDAAQVVAAMDSHICGDAGICCHPLPGDADDQYATLATVSLDLAQGRMTVHDGGPCTCDLAAA
ncbi:MAG: C45 family autoproteolytic acyltransferase/hydrolase [Paracoccaceae bacterium]